MLVVMRLFKCSNPTHLGSSVVKIVLVQTRISSVTMFFKIKQYIIVKLEYGATITVLGSFKHNKDQSTLYHLMKSLCKITKSIEIIES